MNRHRYGEEYGCPVTDIEYNLTKLDPLCRDCGLAVCYRVSARIIDNELLVKVDRSVLFWRTRPEQKEDALMALALLNIDCIMNVISNPVLKQERTRIAYRCSGLFA